MTPLSDEELNLPGKAAEGDIRPSPSAVVMSPQEKHRAGSEELSFRPFTGHVATHARYRRTGRTNYRKLEITQTGIKWRPLA
jgi:hypothetical protein